MATTNNTQQTSILDIAPNTRERIFQLAELNNTNVACISASCKLFKQEIEQFQKYTPLNQKDSEEYVKFSEILVQATQKNNTFVGEPTYKIDYDVPHKLGLPEYSSVKHVISWKVFAEIPSIYKDEFEALYPKCKFAKLPFLIVVCYEEFKNTLYWLSCDVSVDIDLLKQIKDISRRRVQLFSKLSKSTTNGCENVSINFGIYPRGPEQKQEFFDRSQWTCYGLKKIFPIWTLAAFHRGMDLISQSKSVPFTLKDSNDRLGIETMRRYILAECIKQSGGKYKNQVHVGKNGGKYIIINNKKHYIK